MYTPTTWTTGDIVTAEKLNKIELGITDNIIIPRFSEENGNWTCDINFQEVYDAIQENKCQGAIIAGDNVFIPLAGIFIDLEEVSEGVTIDRPKIEFSIYEVYEQNHTIYKATITYNQNGVYVNERILHETITPIVTRKNNNYICNMSFDAICTAIKDYKCTDCIYKISKATVHPNWGSHSSDAVHFRYAGAITTNDETGSWDTLKFINMHISSDTSSCVIEEIEIFRDNTIHFNTFDISLISLQQT